MGRPREFDEVQPGTLRSSGLEQRLHKATLFPEEAELDYEIHPADIIAGDQFKPEFLAFSPNNRMPAIDRSPTDGGEPITVFETGAILVYLAEKIGRFLPADGRDRKTVLEWSFWQVGNLRPMAGQNHHFAVYALAPECSFRDAHAPSAIGNIDAWRLLPNRQAR